MVVGSTGVLALGVARLRAHAVFSSHLSVLFFSALALGSLCTAKETVHALVVPLGQDPRREASFLSVNQSLQRTLIGPAWVTCTLLGREAGFRDGQLQRDPSC